MTLDSDYNAQLRFFLLSALRRVSKLDKYNIIDEVIGVVLTVLLLDAPRSKAMTTLRRLLTLVQVSNSRAHCETRRTE